MNPKRGLALSNRLEGALGLAREIHFERSRRNSAIPQLSHSLAVCSLVLEYGGEEDAAIAGLLHDAPGKQPAGTLDRIKDMFGVRVATIVATCAYVWDRGPGCDATHSEIESLAEKLHRVASSGFLSADVICVVGCEELQRLRSLIQTFYITGPGVFARLQDGRKATVLHYSAVATIIAARAPILGSALLRETNVLHLLAEEKPLLLR